MGIRIGELGKMYMSTHNEWGKCPSVSPHDPNIMLRRTTVLSQLSLKKKNKKTKNLTATSKACPTFRLLY